MKILLVQVIALLFLDFSFAQAPPPKPSDPPKVYSSKAHKFSVEILTRQKDVIWGFDFLSTDRIIFTERSGGLKILNLKSGETTRVSGAPNVWAHGQGGLLDVRVHPTQKSKIYLTYSEPVGDDKATTAVALASLGGNSLSGLKKIFSAHEPNDNDIHFGSRIEFDGKGYIFFAVGDRNSRSQVQDLSYHMGKVLRLKEDGAVPSDNPFVNQKGARPEIWSIGVRSPQGLVQHPTTKVLWMAEMGPRGGDEVNILKKSANYGWPVITYGREYYGPKIGEGTAKSGMTQPVVYWVPSISPSAMTFYNGEKFAGWNGDAFLANLSGQHLRRLKLKGETVVEQEELLRDINQRFRNVRPGPDGFLYFSTDSGWIARLMPIK